MTRLKEKYPALQERMDAAWEHSFEGLFQREYGFVALESTDQTQLHFIDLKARWRWDVDDMGYKEIDLSDLMVKLEGYPISDWSVRVVYHTHPFERCYEICWNPNRARGFGPSRPDRLVGDAYPKAFHVVREIKGEDSYEDLFYGSSSR